MRIFINKEDVEKVKSKYGQGDVPATYSQSTKPTNQRQVAEMFAIVSNPNAFVICKLDRKYEEESCQEVEKSDIQNLKVSGLLNKKITFTANNQDYTFWFKPNVIGSAAEQKAMIKEFEKCK